MVHGGAGMSLRLEEKRIEVDGKTYVLRCNMAVLDALETAYGSFQAVMELPVREGQAAILAAMLNDYAEDMGWEQSWTAKKIKKRFPYSVLLDLDIMGLFTRAVVPESQRGAAGAPADKTEPGDDSGN